MSPPKKGTPPASTDRSNFSTPSRSTLGHGTYFTPNSATISITTRDGTKEQVEGSTPETQVVRVRRVKLSMLRTNVESAFEFISNSSAIHVGLAEESEKIAAILFTIKKSLLCIHQDRSTISKRAMEIILENALKDITLMKDMITAFKTAEKEMKRIHMRSSAWEFPTEKELTN